MCDPVQGQKSFESLLLPLLESCQGVYIKQTFEVRKQQLWAEHCYKIYNADYHGFKTDPNAILICQEQMNVYQKSLCTGQCQGFVMSISQWNMNQLGDTLLNFRRPYQCTVCWAFRPVIDVILNENGILGQIRAPYSCETEINIMDKQGKLRYRITSPICSLNFFCSLYCQTVKFKVYDCQGNHVTDFVKETAGCFHSCLGGMDFLRVGFPVLAFPEDKALLLAAALFLDHRYFEINPVE